MEHRFYLEYLAVHCNETLREKRVPKRCSWVTIATEITHQHPLGYHV